MSNALDRRIEAVHLYEQALVRRAQGNPSGAFPRYRRILDIAEELGDVAWQAQITAELGEMYQGSCDLLDSRRWHEEALRLFRELGDAPREAVTLVRMAQVEQLLGEMVRAEALFREALARWTELGDQREAGRVRGQLGSLLWELRQESAGAEELIAGLQALREVDAEEAAALVAQIRAWSERSGRLRYRRIIQGATQEPELLALLLT
jgi:tetratricopeptide (TPR) repeat protein